MDFKVAAVVAVMLASAAGAAHAEMACLVEGELMSEPIKDCTQTSMPVPPAEYAAQCKANAGVSLPGGGTLRATVLKACPAKAQAACVGLLGRPASAYYYARSVKSLADAKRGCIAQRGRWVDNP